MTEIFGYSEKKKIVGQKKSILCSNNRRRFPCINILLFDYLVSVQMHIAQCRRLCPKKVWGSVRGGGEGGFECGNSSLTFFFSRPFHSLDKISSRTYCVKIKCINVYTIFINKKTSSSLQLKETERNSSISALSNLCKLRILFSDKKSLLFSQ